MNNTTATDYRKPLPGTTLDWYDARAAVDALKPDAWAGLPYTARVHAENIVRKADPAMRDAFPVSYTHLDVYKRQG